MDYNHQEILAYYHAALSKKKIYFDVEFFLHLFDQLNYLIRVESQSFWINLPNFINQFFQGNFIVAKIAH